MVDSGSWRLGLALLVAATAAAAQPVPVARQPAPPAPQTAPPPAVPPATPHAAPAAPPADAGAVHRLGRKYPVAPAQNPASPQPPQVYVSVVSPSESTAHQKTGRFRRERAADAGTGNVPMR